MKNRCVGTIVSLVMGVLTIQGVAFAHGTEMHDKTAPAEAQMQKLHAMMPMFSVASAKLEAALEKGDMVAVKAEAGKILAALPDLKKSKPHKNLKQLATFKKIASAFEENVKKTAVMAKTGNVAGAKAAFHLAQKRCDECHVKFRD